jgi:hypothetical protein
VWTNDPDVAVTVIVDVPAGVPVGAGGVGLLHPTMPIARRSVIVTNVAGANLRWRWVLVNKIVLSRIAASAKLHNTNCGGIRGVRGVDGGNAPRTVVAIESVDVVAVAPGVTLVGLNVAVAAVGNPAAENVIAFAKPPVAGVAVIVNIAVCPAVTVTADVGPLMAKSMPVPVSVAVCVVGEALSVSVSVAGPNDPVDIGVKVMLTTHVPPPATVAPFVHVVPAAMAKFVALVAVIVGAAENVNPAPPWFVTVIVCTALAVFTPWLVKERVVAESAAVGGVEMFVVSAATSFVVTVSPPPETVAVFVTLAGAFAATFTVRVIAW